MVNLTPYGLAVDVRPDNEHLHTATEIESLGFGALWINGGQLDSLDRLTELVLATIDAVVGSAVIVPDSFDADEVADFYRRIDATAPGRLLIGLGPARGPNASRDLVDYADRLDAGSVPRECRLLAAFGPRRLDLARDRFAGAVPMMFTVDHTTEVRRRLGPDRLLVLGQYVVIDDDPVTARATARVPLRFLLAIPHYVKSLVRQGFTVDEIDDISDRVVDALVAWGSPERVAAHVAAQRGAGADHVYVSVLRDDRQPTPTGGCPQPGTPFGHRRQRVERMSPAAGDQS
ncbi:MAG: TIGR03620 family F420-dependent LLM class oxidoreductase [Mycobacterium sp.]